MKDMIEQASQVLSQENMELACVFIQKTAVEKALVEIEKRLGGEYEARKQAKLEGQRYVDPIMYQYQMDRVPEQLRVKASGTGSVTQQLAVYEDFSRHIPGFTPPTEAEMAFMPAKYPPSRIDLGSASMPLALPSITSDHQGPGTDPPLAKDD